MKRLSKLAAATASLLTLLALLLALIVALPVALGAPSTAEAQSTGGSFGGGSFGGSSGSSSFGSSSSSSFGGSSSSSYSSSYSSGSSYSSSYTGGGGGGGGGGSLFGFVIVIVFFAVIATFGVASERKKLDDKLFSSPIPGAGSGLWNQMDITAIRLGIDWRAREIVQSRLKELAKKGNTSNPAGLAKLLHETTSLLQSVELAWLYAGASNYSPMSPPQAEGIFRQLAIKARSRFTEEVIRNADGRTESRQASALRAREHEGEGVVVVTLIVAAKREIKDLKSTRDAQELRLALGRLARISANEMVALEVVWSPAEEEDRMSTLELEALYPDLSKIDEASIAGRTFCGHCSGPYAAEVERCPHCGAPNDAKEIQG